MKRAIVIVAVLVFVGGCVLVGWWYVNENPEWWFWLQEELSSALQELGLEPAEAPAGLVVSGFVEAEEASVTTEVGGRIVALHADEGDEVVEGQVVVGIDDSLLLAKIEMAQAELSVAEASLAQVKAGVRQETLDHAREMVRQAIAAREAARVAWEGAQARVENPQELELAVIAAQTQVGVLNYQEQQALALANSAQAGWDFASEAVSLLEDFDPRVEWVPIGSYTFGTLPPEIPLPGGTPDGEYRRGRFKIVVENGKITVYVKADIKVPVDMLDNARYEQATAAYQAWNAWTGQTQAQVAQSGARDYLAELARQETNPLVLEAQANAAESQYEIAASAVGLAQAQVDGLKIGATPEQIAAAEAQVEMSRASLQVLEVQLEKLTLQAPISGLVLERPVHVGEVAMPGAPLMTLADLENLTLTVYVPEAQLGEVQIGQPVSVTVDAYPDRTFMGSVIFIASQAEFTPKNVQTREERVSMVFAVKVNLPNPDHALKPGMPADAVLIGAGKSG